MTFEDVMAKAEELRQANAGHVFPSIIDRPDSVPTMNNRRKYICTTVCENSQLLKSYRLSMGLTQTQMGELLGIASKTYSNYECADKPIGINIMNKAKKIMSNHLNLNS